MMTEVSQTKKHKYDVTESKENYTNKLIYKQKRTHRLKE